MKRALASNNTDEPTKNKQRIRDDYIDVRPTEKREIMDFLKSKNGFVHVCGLPGTGKTMLVSHLTSLIDEATVHHINCISMNQPDEINERLEALGFFNHNKRSIIDRRRQILVLDEMDQLYKGNDEDTNILSQIILTTTNEDIPRSVIAISNTLDQRWTMKLDNITRAALEHDGITFPPYNVNQLQQILEQTYGERTHPAAIKAVAANSAANGGDVRLAFGLCEMTLDKHPIGEQVSFKTAQRVMAEVFKPPTNQLVVNIPFDLKVILGVCLYLKSRVTRFFINDVLQPYARFYRAKSLPEKISSSDLLSKMDLLHSMGLISINPRGKKVVDVKLSREEFVDGLRLEDKMFLRSLLIDVDDTE